jgi:uncharacterized integral membrane protein
MFILACCHKIFRTITGRNALGLLALWDVPVVRILALVAVAVFAARNERDKRKDNRSTHRVT